MCALNKYNFCKIHYSLLKFEKKFWNHNQKTPPKGVKKSKPKKQIIIKSKEVMKSSNKAKEVEFLPVNPAGICPTELTRFLSDDAYWLCNYNKK